MPDETKEAVKWAINQRFVDDFGDEIVVRNTNHLIVDFVRKYFNDNEVIYQSFSFKDLEIYL